MLGRRADPTSFDARILLALLAGESSPPLARKDWASGDPLAMPTTMAVVGDFDLAARLSHHDHQPRTPDWLCTTCDQDWPCDQARRDLLLDLGWRRVAIYCAVLMERAAADLAAANPHHMWMRFIGWTGPLTGIADPRLKQSG